MQGDAPRRASLITSNAACQRRDRGLFSIGLCAGRSEANRDDEGNEAFERHFGRRFREVATRRPTILPAVLPSCCSKKKRRIHAPLGHILVSMSKPVLFPQSSVKVKLWTIAQRLRLHEISSNCCDSSHWLIGFCSIGASRHSGEGSAGANHDGILRKIRHQTANLPQTRKIGNSEIARSQMG